MLKIFALLRDVEECGTHHMMRQGALRNGKVFNMRAHSSAGRAHHLQ